MASTPSIGTLLLPEMKVVSAENSRQHERRFTFLWTSAHRLLPTNAVLANHMIASMMQLARANQAQLPQAVLDYICESCGGLLVPSVSADVRVVPQSRKSPANRRLARQRRRAQLQNGSNGARLVHETLSNVVRVACHRCQHVSERAGASVIHKAKTKKRGREEQQTTAIAPDTKKMKVDSGEAARNDQPKAALSSGAPLDLKVVSASISAPSSSPPRKLLDGPKKRKKKKTQPDAAVVAVKNSLTSFLQSLSSRK